MQKKTEKKEIKTLKKQQEENWINTFEMVCASRREAQKKELKIKRRFKINNSKFSNGHQRLFSQL